jgi:hypothetical protein
MLGFVSERIPRSGALGLALMGGAGMGVVGLVAAPLLGNIADRIAHERFEPQMTVAYLERASAFLSGEIADVPADQQADVRNTIGLVDAVLARHAAAGELPEVETANAFRGIIGSGVQGTVVDEARAILGPAENYGGRLSFRYLVPPAILVTLIFGFIYWNDKRRGGYREMVAEAAAGHGRRHKDEG